MKPNDKPCRLGRRPVKQGPRPLLSDQDRVGKSATGRNMNIEDGTMQLRKKMRIGTWNVRSMLQLGKVQNLGRELERLRVEICGIAEVRWSGRGHFDTSDGHMNIYSGEESQGHSGGGVWINKGRKTAVIGYETVSSRILVVRLKAKPRCISLVQVYAPTAERENDEIEVFYQEMTNTLKKIPKRDITVMMGDFNAKVGSVNIPPVTGGEGLGRINERGERLIDFCMEQEICLTNTWFKQHQRRLYTWTAPDGNTKNQIDYASTESGKPASTTVGHTPELTVPLTTIY